MSSRRILITGLASVWGGRLARELERDPEVDTVVGIDTEDPQQELQHTEFVRTKPEPGPLSRIIRAAGIDTVVETTLVTESAGPFAGRRGEAGVKRLHNLLEAASRGGVGTVVVKSSANVYGCGRDAPAFFTEEMTPLTRSDTPTQRELSGAEHELAEYADRHSGAQVTVLRCATAVGGGLRSPQLSLLGLPVIPSILGFDPRWQFVHEDDIVGALAHVVLGRLSGAFNVAGDGVLALSEVAGLLGKRLLPVLPPWGTLFAATQARRLGAPVPVELLRELRYGRGLDNRRLKATGYMLRYTSREAVLKLRAHQRILPLLGSGHPDDYRYEPEVEEFLRRSPSVQNRGVPPGPSADPYEGNGAATSYASLTQGELLQVIPSLETAAMRQLRDHEAAGPARPAVLQEIDHQLELRGDAEDS